MPKSIMIHQPDFIPWLGFLNRWNQTHVLIILDDVQLLRKGWHNRDKIKTPKGPQWLTLPCLKKGLFDQKINETFLDYSTNFDKKHLATIRGNYSKSINFNYLFPKIEAIYLSQPAKLMDLNLKFLELARELYGITTPITFASSFTINTTKTERLIDLVEASDGTIYLTGMGSRDYLDEDLFNAKEIAVKWDKYLPIPYKQLFGEFEQGLSFIDHAFNNDLASLNEIFKNEI